MLEIKKLVKNFGGFRAVNNFGLKVEKGTIHGIIGENGAGKTTIIKCIAGIYKPDGGEILLDGQPVYENPAAKVKIGYVADSNTMFEDYTPARMRDFFAEVYPDFDKEKYASLNEIFKLDQNRRVGRLSKGQQMRLSFMLAIASNPELLILDEPTSGLDALAKKQLLDIVIGEVEQNGLAAVISSHHLSELEKLCDEITIIQNGEVQYQSNIDDIKGRVKKLQVIFDKTPDIDTLKESFGVERLGSVYYLTTTNYDENTVSALKLMGASVIEEIGISLEEIFVITAESR
ncbi:MAG: ABC transporter ATP-binding protein [Firmicutes bacterium]|nr:ABC transporter ATP-binding protein [Bacillota bacterium]